MMRLIRILRQHPGYTAFFIILILSWVAMTIVVDQWGAASGARENQIVNNQQLILRELSETHKNHEKIMALLKEVAESHDKVQEILENQNKILTLQGEILYTCSGGKK